MAETAAERAAAIKDVVTATENKDPEVQRAAVEAMAPIPPPTDKQAGPLWMILVIGLIVILIIALGGVIYLLADGDEKTSPDVALTAFTAALTGLLGLFAPSPTS